MRRVDRAMVLPPPSLATPHASVASERADALSHYLPNPVLAGSMPPRIEPSYPFKAYGSTDVRIALDNLFHGKCAYCEGEVGAQSDEDVEHYRPKAGVKDDALHNGYWWLASDWNNLLLSCQHCNQSRRQHIVSLATSEDEYRSMLAQPATQATGKLNQFPVAGTRAYHPSDQLEQEQPALIDPTVDDPNVHLIWVTSSNYSLVVGRPLAGGEDPRGAATVAICALNRARLVRDRTALLTQLRMFRTIVFDQLNRDDSDAGVATALDMIAIIRSFTSIGHNYTALASAFVEEVIEELNGVLVKRRERAAATTAAR